MKKKSILLLIFILSTFVFAKIPSNYMGIKWGSDFDSIKDKFQNISIKERNINNLSSYISYSQYNPTPIIRERRFYFFEGGLAAVYIIYIYGPDQLDKLKAISRALLKDFGHSRIKSYYDDKYGRVLEHINWDGEETEITWFLSQSGTEVAVTGQINYLYFESKKYKKLIANAIKEYQSQRRQQQESSTREERGY